MSTIKKSIKRGRKPGQKNNEENSFKSVKTFEIAYAVTIGTQRNKTYRKVLKQLAQKNI